MMTNRSRFRFTRMTMISPSYPESTTPPSTEIPAMARLLRALIRPKYPWGMLVDNPVFINMIPPGEIFAVSVDWRSYPASDLYFLWGRVILGSLWVLLKAIVDF